MRFGRFLTLAINHVNGGFVYIAAVSENDRHRTILEKQK